MLKAFEIKSINCPRLSPLREVKKKNELKLDDEIRFYYKIQDDELVGCFFESVAYRDRVEFTIQEDEY